MASIDQMTDALNKQKQLAEQDNALSQKSFQMNEQLYKEKVISAEEYRQAQSQQVSKQMAIPQINSSILANQNQQRDKAKELEQLDKVSCEKANLGSYCHVNKAIWQQGELLQSMRQHVARQDGSLLLCPSVTNLERLFSNVFYKNKDISTDVLHANIWTTVMLNPEPLLLQVCTVSELTLNLLTTTIVAPPSNASKWQMGFNSAFKGLRTLEPKP
jgi:hypothetical protein